MKKKKRDKRDKKIKSKKISQIKKKYKKLTKKINKKFNKKNHSRKITKKRIKRKTPKKKTIKKKKKLPIKTKKHRFRSGAGNNDDDDEEDIYEEFKKRREKRKKKNTIEGDNVEEDNVEEDNVKEDKIKEDKKETKNKNELTSNLSMSDIALGALGVGGAIAGVMGIKSAIDKFKSILDPEDLPYNPLSEWEEETFDKVLLCITLDDFIKKDSEGYYGWWDDGSNFLHSSNIAEDNKNNSLPNDTTDINCCNDDSIYEYHSVMDSIKSHLNNLETIDDYDQEISHLHSSGVISDIEYTSITHLINLYHGQSEDFSQTDGSAHGVNTEPNNDLDNDGIPNDEDPDIDNDGIPNDEDPDIDNDGILNDEDPDIDNDEILNDEDPDIDHHLHLHGGGVTHMDTINVSDSTKSDIIEILNDNISKAVMRYRYLYLYDVNSHNDYSNISHYLTDDIDNEIRDKIHRGGPHIHFTSEKVEDFFRGDGLWHDLFYCTDHVTGDHHIISDQLPSGKWRISTSDVSEDPGSADNPVIDLLKDKINEKNNIILIVTQLGDDNIDKIKKFLENSDINNDDILIKNFEGDLGNFIKHELYDNSEDYKIDDKIVNRLQTYNTSNNLRSIFDSIVAKNHEIMLGEDGIPDLGTRICISEFYEIDIDGNISDWDQCKILRGRRWGHWLAKLDGVESYCRCQLSVKACNSKFIHSGDNFHILTGMTKMLILRETQYLSDEIKETLGPFDGDADDPVLSDSDTYENCLSSSTTHAQNLSDRCGTITFFSCQGANEGERTSHSGFGGVISKDDSSGAGYDLYDETTGFMGNKESLNTNTCGLTYTGPTSNVTLCLNDILINKSIKNEECNITFIHEFAHAIHGAIEAIEPNMANQIIEFYEKYKTLPTTEPTDYACTNKHEWFASTVQHWFGGTGYHAPAYGGKHPNTYEQANFDMIPGLQDFLETNFGPSCNIFDEASDLLKQATSGNIDFDWRNSSN